MGKKKEKISWIVKRYPKYGKKYWIEMKSKSNSRNDMENTEEIVKR